jgi:hypothetical protein
VTPWMTTGILLDRSDIQWFLEIIEPPDRQKGYSTAKTPGRQERQQRPSQRTANN